MKILALESTGRFASVALIRAEGREGRLAEEDMQQLSCCDNYSHLQRLCPMIEELLAKAGCSGEELSAIAVSRGPGSFTGIRIGLESAKALALVWNKPVIEVPTLKSFAAGRLAKEGSLICPLFDARRSQVYAAAYRVSRGGIETAVPDGAYGLDEYLQLLRASIKEGERAVFFGDGADAFKDELSGFDKPFGFAPEEERYQKAENVARLALSIDERKDAFTAAPEYLRMAEAERKLKENGKNISQ